RVMRHLVFFLVIFTVLPWYISGRKCGDNGQCKYECSSGEELHPGACFRIHRCCAPTETRSSKKFTGRKHFFPTLESSLLSKERKCGDNGQCRYECSSGEEIHPGACARIFRCCAPTDTENQARMVLKDPGSVLYDPEQVLYDQDYVSENGLYDDFHNVGGKEVFEDLTGSDSNPNYADEASYDTLDNNS
ncbi:unnamed protein product, partial [Meganyctiphanes norvegica]